MYHVELYRLYYDELSKRLRTPNDPLDKISIPASHPVVYYYTLPTHAAGVYSVELTVKDNADNQRQARELLFFDPTPKITVESPRYLVIRECDMYTKYERWITRVKPHRRGAKVILTVDWRSLFPYSEHLNINLLAAVEPRWKDGTGIDDDLIGTGNRTMYAVNHDGYGIVGYQLAYDVVSQRPEEINTDNFSTVANDAMNATTRLETLSPKQWLNVDPRRKAQILAIDSLDDGETIVVWLRIFDATGSSDVVKSCTHVDTSPPVVGIEMQIRRNYSNDFSSR